MTRRRNPTVGAHPDLFEKGETPVMIPLSDLSEEEIRRLKVAQLTQAEWDELDGDVQQYIIDHDPDEQVRIKTSEARVEKMVAEFVKRHEWLDGRDMSHLKDSFESDFDQMFSEYADELVQRARDRNYDVDEFVDEWKGQGYSEEQCENALKEALQDNNNYVYDYHADEYGRAFFKARATESFYIDRHDLDEIVEGMSEEEIEEALKEINRKTYLSLKPKDLQGKYELDIYDYATYYADADPDWEGIISAAQDTLESDVKRGEEDEEVAIDTRSFDERIVHKFKDGSYVIDLQPGELAAEGKAMGMCVGRADMGYIDEVRRGRTKILSLRTAAGRPKFTFEVDIEHGKPVKVEQIKGKANRLPGWDLGKAGEGVMKADEVEKCIEVVEKLGIDPAKVSDLRPALEHKRLGPKKNPSRLPTSECRRCGSIHQGAKSFCDPVGA